MSDTIKLCSTCSSEKWLPLTIEEIDTYLQGLFKRIDGVKNVGVLRRNIAYNLQYIQFQIKLVDEIKVNSVILTQNWKMMIISGVSIIEVILYYVLISKKLNKKSEWEDKPMFKMENHKEIDGGLYKIQTLIFKKITEKNSQMCFDEMIRIVSSKKILGEKSKIYEQLNYLKKLRNKVHLYAEDFSDSDWNSFKLSDINLLKKILLTFLVSSFFNASSEDKKIFNFLKQFITLKDTN